jgi:hypothetical protein
MILSGSLEFVSSPTSKSSWEEGNQSDKYRPKAWFFLKTLTGKVLFQGISAIDDAA